MNTPTLQPGLTVALITKNEADNLEACLQSLAGLDAEIVIIDSGSTDATAEIAARHGARFYVHADWPGFGPQRNRAHQYIRTEWVLWLDADERLSDTLKQSIQTALRTTSADACTVFAFNRLSNTFGAFIRHCGWYPDWVVRLYPTAFARYSDDLVHEKVLLPADTRVEKLEGDALLHGISSFVKMYLLKAGFLDGKHGLLLSVLSAQSAFNKYAALWLLGKKKP